MKKGFHLIFYLIALFCLSGCTHKREVTIIVLQPMGGLDTEQIQQVKNGLLKIYPVKFFIANRIALPANAYYAPQKRYSADTLLKFLSKKKGAAYTIVGLTNQDIYTAKNNTLYWGVMGLGTLNADASIVSAHRLHQGNLLLPELIKLTAHEIGHNFGLPHCPDKTCIMADAEGHNNFYRETGLCQSCRKKLIDKDLIIN